MKISFATLCAENARGKSINRIIANSILARSRGEIRGVVLDLASGSRPSYRRFLQLTGNPAVRVVAFDLEPAHTPDVIGDLGSGLPFRDQAADWAILCSFLNIAADPTGTLREVRRVLAPGGTLLLTAPLTFPYTPEPSDYQRFTEEGLMYHLTLAGFSNIEIVPYGGRWTSAAYLLSPFIRPRLLLLPLVSWLCMRLDQLTQTYFKRLTPGFIGYVVKASGAL